MKKTIKRIINNYNKLLSKDKVLENLKILYSLNFKELVDNRTGYIALIDKNNLIKFYKLDGTEYDPFRILLLNLDKKGIYWTCLYKEEIDNGQFIAVEAYHFLKVDKHFRKELESCDIPYHKL